MKIFYINSSGGGYADHIEVQDGITLGQFFQQQMPEADPADYLIRLNRQPAASHERLSEGCRVSITGTKYQGAARAA